MSEFPAVIDPADIAALYGDEFAGEANSRAGFSVASAGDFDGDGFDDFLIGARNWGPSGGPYNYGATYLVFGGASGATMGFRIDGAFYDHAGTSVSSAGDINNDGFDDLIIGAPTAQPHGDGDYTGAAYVVFGEANPVAGSLGGFTISGAAGAESATGWSVAGIGDVNGDGIDDVMVGAMNADTNGPTPDNAQGAAYVVFGKGAGFGSGLDVTALDGNNGFKLTTGIDYDHVGWDVSAAGDLNGDGIGDLVIGALGSPTGGDTNGASYVVFGRSSGFSSTFDLTALDGNNGFAIDAADDGLYSGRSVESAGDVNGDGIDDLIVGSSHGVAFVDTSAYVVYGRKSGLGPAIDLDDIGTVGGPKGFRIAGLTGADTLGGYTLAVSDAFGFSVDGAGDVNGDGFDDVIVGAPSLRTWNGLDYTNDRGGVFVVFGSASGPGTALAVADLDGANGFAIGPGLPVHGLLGYSVSGAGDLNGDGFDDIVVGAPNAGSSTNDGMTYVVYGRAPDGPVMRVGSKADQSIRGGDFDDTLSGQGGDDALYGAGDADELRGGKGGDTLQGGGGGDKLAGGAGSDTFVFLRASDSKNKSADLITDLGNHDTIDLSSIDANSLTPHNQAFHLIAGAFTSAPGELRLTYSATSDETRVRGDIDGDGRADFTIVLAGDHEDFAGFLL